MKQELIRTLRRQPVWIMLVMIFVFVSLMSDGFLNVRNLVNVANQISIYGILAIGMTYLLISGNWDLSIGSNMAIAAGLTIVLQSSNLVIAIAVPLLASGSIGLLNGLLVAKAKINSFIATMAMNLILRGFVYVIIGERAVLGSNELFGAFGSFRIGGLIPIVIPVFIALLTVFSFLLANSQHGRNAYAVGGNMEATVNAGINVVEHIIINYIFAGLLAAVTGIFLASQMNAATAVYGVGYEMLVITMVLVGGTKVTGGDGSLVQTLGGLMVINVLRNGLDQLGIDSNINTLIVGLILLIFVFFDTDGIGMLKKVFNKKYFGNLKSDKAAKEVIS